MERELNIPVDADIASTEGDSRSWKASSRFYALPREDGKVATNKVFIPLFNPASCAFFRGTEAYPSDIWTYYVKIPGHFVSGIANEQGEGTHSEFVVCPVELDKYLTEILGYKPRFAVDDNSAKRWGKCYCCEESSKHWIIWKDEWSRTGVDRYAMLKEDGGKDKYKAYVAANPVLQEARDTAQKYSTRNSFYFPVFDVSKLWGERPLDEGEETVSYQIYPGPETVWKALYLLHRQVGVKFFSLEDPKIILITRDNSKGSRYCDYDVQDYRHPYNFPEQVMSYLSTEDQLPDFSDLVTIMEPSELAELSGLGHDTQQAVTATVAPPAPPATVAPPAIENAPVAPAPTAPQAPPVQAAPTPVAAPASAPVQPTTPVPQGAAPTQAAPVPGPTNTNPPAGAAPAPVAPPAEGTAPNPPNRTRGRNVW